MLFSVCEWIFSTYGEQYRFTCKLFLHFSHSCDFTLLHSNIACHELFGINVREINKSEIKTACIVYLDGR